MSGIAEVTSPPYDVIGPAAVARLRAADPHNVVRLILPRTDAEEPDGGSRAAATTLKQWLADGVLVQDQEAALYVYEQRDRDGRVLQRGLIGGVGLSPPQDGVVLPHEDVMPGPVAGRLQLMEAVRANLEPIFLLYDGAAGAPSPGDSKPGDGHPGDRATTSAATALVDQVATTRSPLLDVTTEDALTHRLWAITDPAELATIAADLAPRQALIADGHHRYAAYLELRSRMRAAGAGAGRWDQGLALLVDSAAYPPRIDPIHRVIPGLPLAGAVARAGQAFRVSPAGPSLAEALTALADAGQHGPAFLIGGASGAGHAGGGQELRLLTDPDPAQAAAAMPEGRSPHWRGLDAAVLQQLLIGRLWGIRDDPRTVLVVHHDAQGAIQAAADSGGTAVICNPVSAADVTAVAADGERVPRKSTSFGPKPRTGLVIRTFDQA